MAKAVQIVDALTALVDLYAPVRVECDKFRPTQNTADRLWKQIKPYLEGRPNDQPTTLTGSKYVIELDACQIVREVKISKPGVFDRLKKAFGAKRFWELLSFPVTPIDALYDKDAPEIGELISSAQTGYRKILSVRQIEGLTLAKAA